MDSHSRFRDQDYKNWLKTAESLSILRSNIRDFVENETETYHSSLRKTLQGVKCEQNCSLKKIQPSKKLPLCDKCEKWKAAILKNHEGSSAGVHWDNCNPCLWSTDKWEVAKVHMPRGQREHRSFDQFDISAILNYMAHCKHFKRFIQGQHMNKVINVRNTVMHSPDFRLNNEKMKDNVESILKLASLLDRPIPKLHQKIEKNIKEFEDVLQNSDHQASQIDGNKKLLDKEHQALKEKIEFLTQCYEADQNKEMKEELLGMKNFLDQNKDLLENLRPQVDLLNEMQQRVNQHDLQIEELNVRVDDLEKVTNDPMFSNDPLKFKNHLIEQAQKRKWEEPVFTEELEASGYRGQVTVNGKIFKGSQVCNSKKAAHQEVAKKALESLISDFESMEELPTATTITSVSSTSILFYGTITLLLNKDICSEECVQDKEAIESAYMKLTRLLGLNSPDGDNTFKTMVLEHWNKYSNKPPLEVLDKHNDKFSCRLELRNHFIFQDKEGSTTKKKAEQQVAKIALEKLSGFLNYSMLGTDENYKGFLKERLEALGLKNPDYKIEQNTSTEETEDLNTSSSYSHTSSTEATQQEKENANLQPKDSATVVQHPPTSSACATVSTMPEIREPIPTPSDMDMANFTEVSSLLTVYHLNSSSATVSTDKNVNLTLNINLEKFTFQNTNGFTSKKEAIRKTYSLLGQALGILELNTDVNNATMLVKQDFTQKSLGLPKEDVKGVKDFTCSLGEITYNLVYDGQGSTEAGAKLDALQKAQCTLPLLFGYKDLPTTSSAEKSEERINELLRKAGQKDLTFSFRACTHKISFNIKFKDYTVESTSQQNKKENRNLLSKRILGLLGVETDPHSSSLRNSLDDWFKQKSLKCPVFEDTAHSKLGSTATFSVDLNCTHPDWEESLEKAEEKLVQELRKRFQYLTE